MDFVTRNHRSAANVLSEDVGHLLGGSEVGDMAVRRETVGENWAAVWGEWGTILPILLLLLVIFASPLLYDLCQMQ